MEGGKRTVELVADNGAKKTFVVLPNGTVDPASRAWLIDNGGPAHRGVHLKTPVHCDKDCR